VFALLVLVQLLFPPWSATAVTVTRRNEVPSPITNLLSGAPFDTSTQVDRDSLHWSIPFWPVWSPPVYEEYLWLPASLVAAMTGPPLTQAQKDSLGPDFELSEVRRLELARSLRIPPTLRGPDNWSQTIGRTEYFVARDKAITFHLDLVRLGVQILATVTTLVILTQTGQLFIPVGRSSEQVDRG
jgi:hypothetical protein